METIKIFLASSSELANERKAFREFLGVENDLLHEKGGYLKLIQWEYFLDTISDTRLQDEYNEAVKTADIVICLFHTKAGKYTLEEFEVAYKQFKETGKPLIYTYFKMGESKEDVDSKRASDLRKFKKRLAEIGHFYTYFKNIDALKYKFKIQLDLLKNKGIIQLQEQIKRKVDNKLPDNLITNLITSPNHWFKALKREIIKQNVSVGNDANEILEHYGWLIGEFLRKMATPEGREKSIKSFSFMTEAFQTSVRYLCFIQVIQILPSKLKNPIVSDFLDLQDDDHLHFDYLNLLATSTILLGGEESFVSEIWKFTKQIFDEESELSKVTIFLDKHRRRLIEGNIVEKEEFPQLFERYLTSLVFWLRKISFIAKYRLASIKEINLNYRLGTSKNFIHLYGELNAFYRGSFMSRAVEDDFTYNQSVLLFRGSNIETCLDNISDKSSFLSLSPFIIDKSALIGTITQTPEIFYFIGRSKNDFKFAHYRSELKLENKTKEKSIEEIQIRENNVRSDRTIEKYDELFEQMEDLFEPFKTENI